MTENIQPPYANEELRHMLAKGPIGSIAIDGSLVYRGEHSRHVEQFDHFSAIEDLKNLGHLVSLSDVNPKHGRFSVVGEDWHIRPDFKNGYSDNGNNNIYHRSVLYTADQESAHEFARRRGWAHVRSETRSRLGDRLRREDPASIRAANHAQTIRRMQETYDKLSPDDKKRFLDPNERYFLRGEEGRLAFVNHLSGKKVVHSDEPLTDREIKDEILKRENGTDRTAFNELMREAAQKYRLYVYDIVSRDPDVVVLNRGFDPTELSPDDRDMYYASISRLLQGVPITLGAPLDFAPGIDRGAVSRAISSVREENSKRTGQHYLFEDAVEPLKDGTGLSDLQAERIIHAVNAQVLLLTNTRQAAAKAMNSQAGTFEVSTGLEENPRALISRDYIEYFLKANKIVGLLEGVESATLGRRVIVTSLFDLHSINTPMYYEQKREQDAALYAGMAAALKSAFSATTQRGSRLISELSSAYGKNPIPLAKRVEGFDEIFSADAGNWEGFTLEEHTSTVLKNFAENYADELPVPLLGPSRLALLLHDVGKPVAVSKGEKHNQFEYNLRFAQQFMEKVGLKNEARSFTLGLLRGMHMAEQSAIFGRDEGLPLLRKYAEKELSELMGVPPTEDSVDGYMNLCEMLLTCDSGAYTSRAVTIPNDSLTYRNYPSFEASFAESVRLGRRDLKLKNAGIAARSRS